MKFSLITALSLVTGVLGGPVATQVPQLQTEKSLFPNVSTILPDLLDIIQGDTSAIDDILDKYPNPIEGDTADLVAGLIGVHLENITIVLREARLVLGTLTNGTPLVDEDGQPCGVMCIVDKSKSLVKTIGTTARKSLDKAGLHALSETIGPFFVALSSTVLVLNAIVGGALSAVAVLVNGIGLAIAAGITYLGQLVSEKEKQRAGGPGGGLTHSISRLIGEALNHKLANL